MNYQPLLEEVKQYVENFFKSHKDDIHFYHDLDHTEGVVAAATQIANHYRLNDKDFFVVLAAAWFHDAGYYEGKTTGHEEKGAEMASNYLQQKNIDNEIINNISQCILATKLPQQPTTLLEQIVCDADLFHLGTDDFGERNKLMRKEAAALYNKEFTKDDWRAKTIMLLKAHHYHTDYCKLLLNDKKEQNLEKLEKKQIKISQEENKKTAVVLENVKTPVDKKGKDDRPDKGIETMFRISSSNHQRLSDMADNKAHIMITTTSIIISVLLSVLLRKLEEYPHLTLPVVLLLIICVTTMVFSILATRPNLPKGTFTQDDIENKKVNLLFFGNFYKMSLEDYTLGMESMMNSREFLYGSLIRDVYSQGIVLGRKYRLLRIGYSVFMFGIVASVIAFLVASLFFK